MHDLLATLDDVGAGQADAKLVEDLRQVVVGLLGDVRLLSVSVEGLPPPPNTHTHTHSVLTHILQLGDELHQLSLCMDGEVLERALLVCNRGFDTPQLQSLCNLLLQLARGEEVAVAADIARAQHHQLGTYSELTARTCNPGQDGEPSILTTPQLSRVAAQKQSILRV